MEKGLVTAEGETAAVREGLYIKASRFYVLVVILYCHSVSS